MLIKGCLKNKNSANEEFLSVETFHKILYYEGLGDCGVSHKEKQNLAEIFHDN